MEKGESESNSGEHYHITHISYRSLSLSGRSFFTVNFVARRTGNTRRENIHERCSPKSRMKLFKKIRFVGTKYNVQVTQSHNDVRYTDYNKLLILDVFKVKCLYTIEVHLNHVN